MTDPVAELAARGRALSEPERVRLVNQLLQSLNEPALGEIDASWADEVARRLAAFRAGLSQPLAAEDVVAEAHQRAR